MSSTLSLVTPAVGHDRCGMRMCAEDMSALCCAAHCPHMAALSPAPEPTTCPVAQRQARLAREHRQVGHKIVALKAAYPGADLGRVLAGNPRVLLLEQATLERNAAQVPGTHGTAGRHAGSMVVQMHGMGSPALRKC